MGQLNRGRNRKGEALGDKAHCLPPSPIVFFPRFSFRVPETLTLPQPQKQKTHQKKLPATQATKTFFMLSTTCPKYIIHYLVNDPHHR